MALEGGLEAGGVDLDVGLHADHAVRGNRARDGEADAPDLLSLLGGGAQKGGYTVGDRRVAGGIDERGRRDAPLAQELARLVE